MLAKVGDEPLLKLLPAPITLECFLSSPAVTRVYELPRWLVSNSGVRAPSERAACRPQTRSLSLSSELSAVYLRGCHQLRAGDAGCLPAGEAALIGTSKDVDFIRPFRWSRPGWEESLRIAHGNFSENS